MAIRTFELAIDNHPVYGYATVEEISGSGVFRIRTGVRRIQAATLAIAEQYPLPHEFIPSADSTLYTLSENSATEFAIQTHAITPAPATVPSTSRGTVLDATVPVVLPSNGGWVTTDSPPGEADLVTLAVGDMSGDTLYLITHNDYLVDAKLVYVGGGTDVSATYGLPTGSRFKLMEGVTKADDLAEMVFVDGVQLVGDIYNYEYEYGEGAYKLIFTELLELHAQLTTAVDTVTQALTFFVFSRMPRPMLRVRANDPFSIYDGEWGVWVEYFNIPKGDMVFNYMFH